MGISAELVGKTFEPTNTGWEATDTVLYALGVGATPAEELDFLYEGRGPKVLPTFAVIPGMRASSSGGITSLDIDMTKLLHGEQSVTLHREIPPEAKVTMQGRIAEVWDKGKAAVLGMESVAEDDQGPLFTTKSTIFVRDAGGFGGDRGPSASGRNQPPDRDPDHVITQQTRIEQGALYRLSGDRNPLHIDPEFAGMAGFDRPILHGLCTYGFAARAALGALCDWDPARFRSLEARFADVVFPGDTVITKIWRTGAEEAVLVVETDRRTNALTHAKVTFT